MTRLQAFFTRILPARWAESMERESRQWIATCECGCERSVWDLGGIRWKARGSPRRYLSCPRCGRRSWHRFNRKPPPA